MTADQAATNTPPSLWQTLAERLAFCNYVPKPVPVALVEERAFVHASGESYYVLKQRERRTYLSLPPEAYELWRMMDGDRSIRIIAVEYALAHKRIVTGLLRGLVEELREKGFLQDPPARIFSGLAERRHKRTLAHRLGELPRSIIARDLIQVRRGDAALGALYRAVGWTLFTWPAVIATWALVLGGLAALGVQLTQGSHSLFKTGDSYLLGFVSVLLIDVLAISLHELGHAMGVKRAGREVIAVGVLLYYGMPCAYVNTTDIWMADRRARILTSWAGPFATLALAGAAGLVGLADQQGPVGDFAFKTATVWFLAGLFNFIPLLELDGYFMLVDLLEMPLLRARSFYFLRQDLWRKLRQQAPWTREERILAWYGVLAAVFSGLMLIVAVWTWQVRGLHVAEELWNLPAWYGKPLLVLFLVLFGGPLLLGVMTLLLSGLGWLYQQLVWKLSERRLLRRAEPLLDALSYLSHLAPTERTALAQHLRPRRVSAGAAVICQGDPPDGFYFILSGEADVEQAGSDGELKHVATLRAGDHFGELAFLNRAPRNATVRARTTLKLYYLDGGHFHRWLAEDMQGRAEVRQRMIDQASLERFPLLSTLTPTERDQLLEHVGVEQFAAGQFILRQDELGDRMYLIAAGRCEVLVRPGGAPSAEPGHAVAELSAGEYFGEIALLRNEPRTASVRAVEPTVCYTLDRKGFAQLLDLAPVSRTAVDRLALQRIRETRAGLGAALS